MNTDVREFHGWTAAQLSKLPTRQLMAIRLAAFYVRKCSQCGFDCGYLEEEDKQFNRSQYKLADAVKEVLSTREHVPSKREGSALRDAKRRSR